MGWNFGDILDGIEPVLAPDRPAFIHGSRVITWGETSRRSNNLARALLAAGAATGDKVAFYMRNRPEYVETVAACYKARLTHVNINYRYTPDEVLYIFDNSDAAVVVYGAEFRATVAQLRPRLTKVKLFVEVPDGGRVADFAANYDELIAAGDGAPLAIARSPDDLLFIYTGGTTGMPKGVMWTHHDLREMGLWSARKLGPVPETLEQTIEAARQAPGGRTLPAPPLMHGTGLLTALAAHTAGGCVVTLTGASFDGVEMAETIDRHRPDSLSLVGDAFGRPLLHALDAAPGRYDLSSVVGIISSGVMWSVEVKRGLLRHMPQAAMSDSFGSSEAIGMGMSVMTADGEVPTAKFMVDERCRVFDEADRPVQPGSGVAGMVAVGPPNPLGYYNDEAKTARTFRTIGGVRYSLPGDFCTVEADGSITLLGRGSVCINTAGEKVFPEEVEEALKTHPAIEDALVVGVPDETWGQAVTAVIELAPGEALDEDAVRRHVRQSLAGYKTPKRVLVAARPLRAANGKADYKTAADFARAQVAAAESGQLRHGRT
ncbi:acyl-CoA synthetase [Chelatococcus reniformis]|uniref:Acyl-CoA synthetase n=1 Tax=Chelatococcus reniformis TaxID=1494448 RepID=A0A916UXE9_9HYPH|nr:acyl-CoA synthetase [Chelatococcus reniformis]GGC93052.1 acyl-CoA synthetase [Chelatococcus reniformis]